MENGITRKDIEEFGFKHCKSYDIVNVDIFINEEKGYALDCSYDNSFISIYHAKMFPEDTVIFSGNNISKKELSETLNRIYGR